MEQISDLVLYQDQQIIVLNKPPGMPVQEDKTGDTSLARLAMSYCKHDLYLVNRIDRPCSGVVIMAKNKGAAAHLSDQYRGQNIEKAYLAVVDSPVHKDEKTLGHRLADGGGAKVEVLSPGEARGRMVSLSYRVIHRGDTLALLEVKTGTGAKHQVRAQLGADGMPIKGDQKYGYKRGNKDRSIQLHAWKLALTHPTKAVPMEFEAPPPDHPIWNIFRPHL